MSLNFWKLKIFSHNLRLSVLTLHAVNKTMSQVKIAYDCQKEYLCKSLSWSMESSHVRYWKLLNSLYHNVTQSFLMPHQRRPKGLYKPQSEFYVQRTTSTSAQQIFWKAIIISRKLLAIALNIMGEKKRERICFKAQLLI